MRKFGLIEWVSFLLIGLVSGCISQQISESSFTAASPYSNSLVGLASPFYQMHAHQPIDWLPWDPALVPLAERNALPILVHSGYSGSYQATLLAREAMMDTSLAAYINAHYIPALVDQEVDPQFMAQLNTCEHPSFPASMPEMITWILSPRGDLLNYYKGPPKGWEDFLRKAPSDSPLRACTQPPLWRQESPPRWRKSDFSTACTAIENSLAKRLRENSWAAGPLPGAALGCLAFHEALAPDPRRRALQARALQRLRMGPLYDHLEGGFFAGMPQARDTKAHFAKRLPDQAAAIQVWAQAYRHTQQEALSATLYQTTDFVLAQLRLPSGGFAAGLAAQSQEEDGRYYLWSDIDVRHTLGDLARYFTTYYEIQQEGNWREGANMLYQRFTEAEIAAGYRMPAIELRGIMDQARERMRAERQRRAAPQRDEKAIVSWNAFLVMALLEAGQSLQEPSYIEAAEELVIWLYNRSQAPSGGRFRYLYDEQGEGAALLEDYAYLSQACLQWYMHSLDSRWLDRGVALLEAAIPLFYDARSGVFQQHAYGTNERPVAWAAHLQLQAQAMMGQALLLGSRLSPKSRFRELALQLLGQAQSKLVSSPDIHAPWVALLGEVIAPRPLIQVASKHHVALQKWLYQQPWPQSLICGDTETVAQPRFGGPVFQAGTPTESGEFPQLASEIAAYWQE